MPVAARFVVIAVLAFGLAETVGAAADAPPDAAAKAAAKKSAAKAPAPPPLTPAQRETAAIDFAREHHPELASLIEKLRIDNRREFDRAIRELAQTRERLARLQKQSPPQYELGLAAWKLDSRSQLLAARLTLSKDPALEDELKHVLRERVDVRLKQLEFERDRLHDRLAIVESSIKAISANKDAAADKDYQRIKRSVARNRRPMPKKPVLKKAADKPAADSALKPLDSAPKKPLPPKSPTSDSQ